MTVIPKTSAQILEVFTPPRFSANNSAEQAQVLTAADTWYKVIAPLGIHHARDFALQGTPDNNILYSGADAIFNFTGDADLKLNATASVILSFGLFLNGVLVDRFLSTTEFSTSDTIHGFGTNGAVELTNGDVFDIRAMCSAAGKTLTTKNIKVSMSLNEAI